MLFLVIVLSLNFMGFLSLNFAFVFVSDPMSVDHVIMLTVALDGKPYLLEISVSFVSK